MAFLDDRRYFVFGLGISGRAVASLLAAAGRDVVACDDNAAAVATFAAETPAAASAAGLAIVHSGPDVDAVELLRSCDRMVLSPGVPLDHPLVVAARSAGIPVDGEIEAAFHFTRAGIAAVTGTNGKSTTVGIIGKILETAGVRSVVAGNVGTPFAGVVGGADDFETIVLELSSFQLDTIDEFRAGVAVLLNVTPDHLDRYHHSFDEYSVSKARILNRADDDTWFVYNDADTVCRSISGGFAGNKAAFSSIGRPQGTHVCYLDGGSIRRNWGSGEEDVLDVSEFTPVGLHNLENAMAAVGAAGAMGVSLDAIRDGLRSYRPLPHRMEPVRIVAGVTFINDSKATNVDATVKSLMGLDGGAVLILGGRDKEGDFSALVPHLGRVRRILLIGEARRVIREALDGKCDLEDVDDMAAAVTAAATYAKKGDTVLLAPACASFDMFDNYQHRGEVFRSCVNALTADPS